MISEKKKRGRKPAKQTESTSHKSTPVPLNLRSSNSRRRVITPKRFLDFDCDYPSPIDGRKTSAQLDNKKTVHIDSKKTVQVETRKVIQLEFSILIIFYFSFIEILIFLQEI